LEHGKEEVDPTFGEAYLYEGVTLRREGHTAGALPYFEKAVELDPNFALSYTTLASAQTELGKVTEAVRTLQVAQQHFPDDAAFPAQLSHLLYRLGHPQEAKQESVLAAKLNRRGNALLGSASQPFIPAKEESTAFQSSESGGAERSPASGKAESPSASVSSGPREADDLQYGILLERVGNSAGALRQMEQAKTLDHYNSFTYLNLGPLQSRLKHYADARKDLEIAVRLDPNLSAAYYCLGDVYHHLGLSELSQAA
jgi:tetratricopeptide (TPR) repeat protein